MRVSDLLALPLNPIYNAGRSLLPTGRDTQKK